MVISETVMSADHKTKRKLYKKIRVFFFFFCFQNVSCGVVVLVCCICMRREMFMRIYLCVCACMRAYVYKGCCNINDTRAGRLGREITAKSDAKMV